MQLTTGRLLGLGCGMLGLAIGVSQLLPALPDTAVGLMYGIAIGLLFLALLRRRLPAPCDSGTPALRRRYLRELMPAIGAYAVLLFLSLWLLRGIDTTWLRAVVALMPLPPIALAILAIVRYIRDTDEMQQKIELEAVSIATASVSLLYMAGGFLQLAEVIDVRAGVAMIWMFPLICATYGVAKMAVSRRYG